MTGLFDKDDTAVVKTSALNEISFIDIVVILWRSKFVIVASTVLITVIGVIYALLSTEVFSTSSCFITKTGGESNGNLGQIAALVGVNMGSGGAVDPSDYLDKVILDKEFLGALLERKWFYNGDSLFLDSILQFKPDTTFPNWKHVFFMEKVEAIRKAKIISLKKDPKNNLLTLSSSAPDPQLAYDLNIFTLDFICSYIRNSIKTQAKEKRIFIEERINESKKKLELAEDALAKFRGNNLMTRSPQALLEEARLTREVAMNQEVYIQFQKQYELARIEELDDQTLVQVVMSAEVPVKRSKPKRRVVVLISGFSGIFFGIFCSVLFYLVPSFILLFRKSSSNKD